MKNANKGKKLTLHRETIRRLEPQDLSMVAGGMSKIPNSQLCSIDLQCSFMCTYSSNCSATTCC
jgi:hypothetical protein